MRILERLNVCAFGLVLCAMGVSLMMLSQHVGAQSQPGVLGLQNTMDSGDQSHVGSPDSLVRQLFAETPLSVPDVDWSQKVVRMRLAELSRRAEVAVTTPAAVAPPLAVAAATSVPAPVPAVPAPAPTAVAITVAPGLSTYESRGNAALERIDFDLSSIGYTISFHPHTGSHRGLTFTRRQHIEVYVKPSMSDGEIAYVIAHEMGHAVDHMRNTWDFRERWQAARGIAPNTDWWPTGVGNDFATPAGDFAECFASWATGSTSHSVWGGCATAMSLVQELVRS